MDCGLENRLRKTRMSNQIQINTLSRLASAERGIKTGNTEILCKMLNNKSNLRSKSRSSQEFQAHYSRYVCCLTSIIACRQPKTFRLAVNVYRQYSVYFIIICNVYSKYFLFILVSDELHVSYPREECKKRCLLSGVLFFPL